MKTKFQLLLISLITAITFLFVYSCNEPELTTPITNNANQETKLQKEISPKALACDQRIIYQWEFDHYSPMPGKEIGFWPHDFADMFVMKTKYGFNNVLVRNDSEVQEAENAGYTFLQMMAKVTVNDTDNYTVPSGDFGSYYLGEYFERYNRNKTYARLIADQLAPKPLFMSSWKLYDNWFTEDVVSKYQWVLNESSNTQMMCDQYHDETLWCGHDQTDHWSEFYSKYHSYRVNAHCIHLYIDGEEGDFSMLFNYANNIGINNLWLYIGNKGVDYCDNGESLSLNDYQLYLNNFLNVAYSSGWLKRYYRLYRYEYRCFLKAPCKRCDQEDVNSEGWYLVGKYPTNQVQEM